MPNSYTTANSPATGISQSQPSHSVDAANPTIQAVSRNRSSHAVNPTTQAVVLPDEELHHQELAQLRREAQPAKPDPSTLYSAWISDWMGHLTGVSNCTLVPPGATAITTPLVQVQ